LAVPLAVAIVNPGTGLASGFYAALIVVLYAVGRYAGSIRFDSVDYMTISVALVVLISPLWAYAPEITLSASRGIVATLFYFITVRAALGHRSDFILFIKTIAWMSAIYAVYFLVNAKATDLATSRVSVDFANANYTGAVLAFGAVATLWQLFLAPASRGTRWAWVAALAIEVWALFETGSRASVAGLFLAVTVALLFRNFWVLARNVTMLLLAIGFPIGFIPQAGEIFRASQSVMTSQVFVRGDTYVENLSGREEIWQSTRETVSQAPILGSGPEGYRLRGSTQILAHSWGLEYMASVGLVGTALLVVVIWFCFAVRGIRRSYQPGRQSWLWNSATALSLLPNLVLSTHQWTLWAWAGFALWSRSHLLNAEAEDQRQTWRTVRE
jgi:O-antigen ligase